MSRFTVIPLIVLLLSACQPSKSPYADAFSPQQVLCQGRMAWSADVTMLEKYGDYTTFWIAFEEDPTQENFQYVSVEVTLDGKPVDGMRYVQSPERYSVTCTDRGQQFESVRVQYYLFLPPLPEGEYELVWKYTLTVDLSDDLFEYPKGMTGEYVGILHVQY